MSAPTTTAPAADTGPELARPKLRRRWGLLAAGAILVALGGLTTAWLFAGVNNTVTVLAATDTIYRGQEITADMVGPVEVDAGPGVATVPAGSLEQVIGMRAALDIAAGGLITAEAVTDEAAPGPGQGVVGIPLTARQLPSVGIAPGSTVELINTPRDGDDPGQLEQPGAVAATVLSTSVEETTGDAIVNVVVPEDIARQLAARAATGRISLIVVETRG